MCVYVCVSLFMCLPDCKKHDEAHQSCQSLAWLFEVVAPKLWNSLPLDLRSVDIMDTFKTQWLPLCNFSNVYLFCFLWCFMSVCMLMLYFLCEEMHFALCTMHFVVSLLLEGAI